MAYIEDSDASSIASASVVTLASSPPRLYTHTTSSVLLLVSDAELDNNEPVVHAVVQVDEVTTESEMPTSPSKESELIKIAQEIRATFPPAEEFFKATEDMVVMLRESNSIDGDWAIPIHNPRTDVNLEASEEADDDLDLPIIMPGEDAAEEESFMAGDVEEGTVLLPTSSPARQDPTISSTHSPIPVRPLPTPPARNDNAGINESSFATELPSLSTLFEEDKYLEETQVMLNNLKWDFKVNPEEREVECVQVVAYDPEDEERQPQDIWVTAPWHTNIVSQHLLYAHCKSIVENTRACLEPLNAENFLLRRRVAQLEDMVETGAKENAETKEKMCALEDKLNMILNNGIHNVATTQIAEQSLDRISRAMQHTKSSMAKVKTPRRGQISALTAHKPRARRAPLTPTTTSVTPNDPLRRRIVSNKLPTKLSLAISFEEAPATPASDTDGQNELAAYHEYRNIMRLGKACSQANTFTIDIDASPAVEESIDHQQHEQSELVRVISGFFGADERAVLDPVLEQEFDNDSQIL